MSVYSNVSKIVWCLLLNTILIAGSSCKKFVDIDRPADQVLTKNVFANDNTAIAAINGLYSQMSFGQNLTNGSLSIFPALSADELLNMVSSNSYPLFSKNALHSSEATVNYNRIWKSGYSSIYKANAILEGLLAASSLTPSVVKQLTGEALFVRALCYFYLVNLYGDVPLITVTDYELNAVKPRSPASEIYQQVIADLIQAESLLSLEYVGNGRTRINQHAASAMLARVYLYLGAWQQAELKATKVIESGAYSLMADLNTVFHVGSNEAIWQLNLENTNTQEGFVFVPFFDFSTPNLILTPSLLNAFEIGDQRKTNWTKTNTINGQDYVYPFKYKVRISTISSEYNTVLRLAEQYLVRAEARAQQDNISGAKADLDVLRIRAGLAATTANDKQSLLLAIEQERRVELFAEWGHRWFDLKRTARVSQVLALEKPLDWQSTDALYPIPLTELQLNPFLVQNPGY